MLTHTKSHLDWLKIDYEVLAKIAVWILSWFLSHRTGFSVCTGSCFKETVSLFQGSFTKTISWSYALHRPFLRAKRYFILARKAPPSFPWLTWNNEMLLFTPHVNGFNLIPQQLFLSSLNKIEISLNGNVAWFSGIFCHTGFFRPFGLGTVSPC